MAQLAQGLPAYTGLNSQYCTHTVTVALLSMVSCWVSRGDGAVSQWDWRARCALHDGRYSPISFSLYHTWQKGRETVNLVSCWGTLLYPRRRELQDLRVLALQTGIWTLSLLILPSDMDHSATLPASGNPLVREPSMRTLLSGPREPILLHLSLITTCKYIF